MAGSAILDPRVDQIETFGGARVVHVISDAGPHPYFRTLIEAGAFDPSRTMVGCVGPAGALQEDMASLGVATFALGARSRRGYALAAGRLSALLRHHEAQIVQTHLPDGCLVGLAAARLARAPVAVMTAHHSHELPFHGRRLLWPERLCAGPLSDHIVAPSHQVAETLSALIGRASTKIEIVHHGFDLSHFDPARIDGGAVRRELGLEDKLVFGAVGRIYRLKNYPALLRAFALALGDTPAARLVIAGPGDARELQSLAHELGIADRVMLLGPRGDVPALLAAFDVFVHAATAESFGMVLIEAMAMERPVVSTPVGIAPEAIGSRTGILTADCSVPALAAALARAMSTRSDWPTMGALGRRRAQTFSAAAAARRYLDLYARWSARD